MTTRSWRTRAIALSLAGSLAVVSACSASPVEDVAVPEPAAIVAPASGPAPDGLAAPTVPQFAEYELFYTSTCGDGAAFTGGTGIAVSGDSVTVTEGEEPPLVGSLALWQDLAAGAASEGRDVQVLLAENGALLSLRIEGFGIDDEFCVEIEDFAVSG